MTIPLARTVVAATLAIAPLALAPERAAAQLEVGVHLSWHWSDGGWYGETARARGDAYYAPAPRTRYRAPTRALRIPPGHLPPPGSCRLWYVGRPPGHQPPPTSCARLFRSYRQPGVVVLQGAPVHRGGDAWYRYDPYRDHDARYRLDLRDGRYYQDDHDAADRRRDRKRGKPGRGRGWGRGGGRGG